MSLTRRSIGAALLPAALALALGATDAVAQGTKVRLVFTATPTNTSQYLWAAQHMKLVAAATGYDITVQESGGTEENMYRIAKQRTAQMGIMDAVLILKKLGADSGIRHVANYSPAVWQIFVARDAGVRTLRDLAGKKFNPGPTGGGSTGITIGILDALGIKPANVEATLSDALEMYSDRQIVGLSYRGTGANPTSGVVEAHASGSRSSPPTPIPSRTSRSRPWRRGKARSVPGRTCRPTSSTPFSRPISTPCRRSRRRTSRSRW
jgi:TRAP-type uncharacterized transport system substrate-binding protein